MKWERSEVIAEIEKALMADRELLTWEGSVRSWSGKRIATLNWDYRRMAQIAYDAVPPVDGLREAVDECCDVVADVLAGNRTDIAGIQRLQEILLPWAAVSHKTHDD